MWTGTENNFYLLNNVYVASFMKNDSKYNYIWFGDKKQHRAVQPKSKNLI